LGSPYQNYPRCQDCRIYSTRAAFIFCGDQHFAAPIQRTLRKDMGDDAKFGNAKYTRDDANPHFLSVWSS
jgi:hypothetical protein